MLPLNPKQSLSIHVTPDIKKVEARTLDNTVTASITRLGFINYIHFTLEVLFLMKNYATSI